MSKLTLGLVFSSFHSIFMHWEGHFRLWSLSPELQFTFPHLGQPSHWSAKMPKIGAKLLLVVYSVPRFGHLWQTNESFAPISRIQNSHKKHLFFEIQNIHSKKYSFFKRGCIAYLYTLLTLLTRLTWLTLLTLFSLFILLKLFYTA